MARERGFQVLRMGDAVWDEVRRQALPLEALQVGKVANEMRTSHGADIWARRTLESVDREADVVIIDGVRSQAELDAFKEELGADFYLVLIDCPDDLRMERVTSRGRDDDTMSLEAFKARDERELSWGLGEILASADKVIPNTGTVEELRSQVSDLLEGLRD